MQKIETRQTDLGTTELSMYKIRQDSRGERIKDVTNNILIVLQFVFNQFTNKTEEQKNLFITYCLTNIIASVQMANTIVNAKKEDVNSSKMFKKKLFYCAFSLKRASTSAYECDPVYKVTAGTQKNCLSGFD